MPNRLAIRYIERRRRDGAIESLRFTDGLNVITGPRDAGKTLWLKFLDYLLGDSGTAIDALSEDVAEAYVGAAVIIEIANVEYLIERRWHEPGLRTKIIVDNEPYSSESFSEFLLRKLDIPVLSFPKGNPYNESAWVKLSWRTIFRHIYRQERFWGDIADRQPDSEQHAALALFLGLAELLFPPEWGQLIKEKLRLLSIEGRRTEYMQAAAGLLRDLSPRLDFELTLSAEAVSRAIRDTEVGIEKMLTRRDSILSGRLQESPEVTDRLRILTETKLWITGQRDMSIASLQALQERERRIDRQHKAAVAELDRLERTKDATNLFAHLRVTHCPVCDQSVHDHQMDDGNCFLCHQTLDPAEATSRLDFELQQLKDEVGELARLRARAAEEMEVLRGLEYESNEQLDAVDRALAPFQTRLGFLSDARLTELDAERGQLEERVRYLRRFSAVLEQGSQFDAEIDQLRSSIGELEAKLTRLQSDVHYTAFERQIEEGMQAYFYLVNRFVDEHELPEEYKWSTNKYVGLSLTDRRFLFHVNGRSWESQMGGTSKLLFLFAYHYALLRLSSFEPAHYPGLLILDFPADLLSVEVIRDQENYVLHPFTDLMDRMPTEHQVIVAGRAFDGLPVQNLIQFDKPYR